MPTGSQSGLPKWNVTLYCKVLDNTLALLASSARAPPGATRTMTSPSSASTLEPRTTRAVLALALTTGVAGDALLKGHGPGTNLAVWLLVVTAALALGLRLESGRIPRDAGRPLVAAVVLAALLALRDAPLLVFGNVCGTLLALALAAAGGRPGSAFDLARTRVRDGVRHSLRQLVHALVGAASVLDGDARHAFGVPQRHRYATLLALRAGAIATVVAGAGITLLVNGDPVFAGLASRLVAFDIDLPLLVSHLVVTGLLAWLALGFFGNAARAECDTGMTGDIQRRLSRLDVLATLGAVNVVLAAFLAVQLRVLFGGLAYVQATTGLTLAAYARSGFFTLEVIGGLALGLLLAMHALLRTDSPGADVAFRRLATPTIALVSLVMVSAVVRMSIYVDQFGWTVDRLYSFAGMLWIAAAFAWLQFTVLGRRPLNFVGGALGAAAAMLVVLNVASPGELVVRANVRRAAAGAPFDLSYPVRMLGADAVPALVSALTGPDALPEASLTADGKAPPCRLVGKLLLRWGPSAVDVGLDATLAEVNARSAVRTHVGELRSRACW